MKTFDVSYRCLNSLQIQRRTSHLFNEYNFRYVQMPRKIEGGSFSWNLCQRQQKMFRISDSQALISLNICRHASQSTPHASTVRVAKESELHEKNVINTILWEFEESGNLWIIFFEFNFFCDMWNSFEKVVYKENGCYLCYAFCT